MLSWDNKIERSAKRTQMYYSHEVKPIEFTIQLVLRLGRRSIKSVLYLKEEKETVNYPAFALLIYMPNPFERPLIFFLKSLYILSSYKAMTRGAQMGRL